MTLHRTLAVALSLLLSMTLLLAATGCGGPDKEIATEDALARTFFDALVKNDLKLCRVFYTTDKDAEYLAKKGGEKNGWDDAEVRGMTTQFKNSFKECNGKIGDGFKVIRERGEKDFGWANATFDSIEAKRPSKDSMWGVDRADIVIRIKAGDKIYLLLLDDCIQFESGWKPTDAPKYRGLEKSKDEAAASKKSQPKEDKEEAAATGK